MLLVSTARTSATPVKLKALAALTFHSTELLINQIQHNFTSSSRRLSDQTKCRDNSSLKLSNRN
jgi:hypothetical protein